MYVTTLINVIKSFVYESKPQEKQELHLKLNFSTEMLPGVSPRLIVEPTCGLNLSNICCQMATLFL